MQGDAGFTFLENVHPAPIIIFRFEGDKVVELWDIGQEIPADTPNEYGMF